MTSPLDGIRVLEVASWIAVPAAGALMADLGATVIKVESGIGDAWRAASRRAVSSFPGNPGFQLDNRGKQGIAINLDRADGQAVVRRLVQSVDVFTTNLVPGRRLRYGLAYEALAATNPRLVYLAFSGYGDDGPDRDRLSFDFTAFWARSGMLDIMAEPDAPPPMPPGSMGDHATAPLLLAAIMTALFERERSGLGQQVQTSLLNSALWALGSDLQQMLVGGPVPKATPRLQTNPMRNSYRAGDGRWFMLMAPAERDWPRVCAALERPELEHDPRFAAFADRTRNGPQLIAEMDATFAVRPRREWGERLDAQGVVWGPVEALPGVPDDPQVQANGYLTQNTHPAVGAYLTLNTPMRFSRSEAGPRGPAPEVGQHTEEVLLAAGYTWDDITALRDSGAIGV